MEPKDLTDDVAAELPLLSVGARRMSLWPGANGGGAATRALP